MTSIQFNDGLAYVWEGEHYEFINPRGQEVVPLFFEGSTPVQTT